MALEDFAGFAVQGYRSFGLEELQTIGPMSRLHLLVGRNNVGKSNALSLVTATLSAMRSGIAQSGDKYFPGALDLPDGWTGVRTVSIGFRRASDAMKGISSVEDRLDPVLSDPVFSRGHEGTVWIDFEADAQRGELSVSRTQFRRFESTTKVDNFGTLLSGAATSVQNQSSSDQYKNWTDIVNRWAPWYEIPRTHLVETFRRITSADDSQNATRSGEGIIKSLASLQSPPYETQDEDEAKWSALGRFVCEVLDDQTARVRIPDRKNTILVSTDNLSAKPIENLGTGIAEVVLLAAACAIHQETLVCIEEPELHLHPTLQRLLIEYLARETSNRYLISTHSAALLNADVASITHLTRSGPWTVAEPVVGRSRLATAVSDLGNRASDLVQSNFVVWVEGPTDRLYISHWLASYDPALVESAHYSIMFYGGSVLNHLAADDQETSELIQLLQINRNLAVVIDSDKKSATAELNATKLRIVSELAKIDGYAWVTDGYTIENYIPAAVIRRTLEQLYPKKEYPYSDDRWTSPLGREFVDEKVRPSKVVVAKHVVNQYPGLHRDELLSNHIAELSARIRRANSLPPL